MKLIKETPQKLLGRIRIKAEFSHIGKATPSNKEIKSQLSKLKKIKEENIIIRHIYTKYGESNSKVYANIYDSEKVLKETETQKSIKKLDEEKKKVEKPIEKAGKE